LSFSVFPHGQCLKLFSEKKTVIFPKPKSNLKEQEEGVSFVEVDPPSPSPQWGINEIWAEGLGIGSDSPVKKTNPVLSFAEKTKCQTSKIPRENG